MRNSELWEGHIPHIHPSLLTTHSRQWGSGKCPLGSAKMLWEGEKAEGAVGIPSLHLGQELSSLGWPFLSPGEGVGRPKAQPGIPGCPHPGICFHSSGVKKSGKTRIYYLKSQLGTAGSKPAPWGNRKPWMASKETEKSLSWDTKEDLGL